MVRAGRTADGVAMIRAVVVARRPLRWLFRRATERAGPGFYGAVVCRTRVIDNVAGRPWPAGSTGW